MAQPADSPTWYPCFTPHEAFVVYAQNGRVMACHLDSQETKQVSAGDHEHRYVNVADVVK